jgi:spore coat protein U-like protein
MNMSTRKTRFGLLSAAAAIVASAGLSAQAQTATANVNVTANVVKNCSMTATPVAFGAYNPLGTGNLDATGSVSVRCTRGITPAPTVSLGNGSFFAAGRRMSDGAATPSFIAYSIFQPASNAPGAACAYTQDWNAAGAGILTLTTPTNSAARTYNLCGRTALGQDVPPGAYADVVVATVTF